MKVMSSRNSGMLVEEGVEGLEAAQDVLGEVGAVDADDQVLAAAAQDRVPRRRVTSGWRASSSNIGALTEIG